jgi:hypothetical protein
MLSWVPGYACLLKKETHRLRTDSLPLQPACPRQIDLN